MGFRGDGKKEEEEEEHKAEVSSNKVFQHTPALVLKY